MKARIDNLMKVARESGKPNQWRKQYESLSKIIVGDNENLAYLHTQWNVWITEIELDKWDEGFTEQIINGGEEVKKLLKDTSTGQTKISPNLSSGLVNNQLNGLSNAGAAQNYNAYDQYAQNAYSQQAHEDYMRRQAEIEKADYYNKLGASIDLAETTMKGNLIQRWLGNS